MATINSSKSAAIQALEAAIHTNRTTTIDGIQRYINTALNSFDELKQFYDQHEIQGLKFLNYQGRQRLDAEMVNIFIDGGKKYNLNTSRRHRRRQQSPQERRRRRRRRKRRDDEDGTSPIAPANPAIKER